MQVPGSLAPETLEDARVALRLDVALTALLRQHGSQHRFAVSVLDLSQTGFRCEAAFSLRKGQALSLMMPGMVGLEARVKWKRDFVYGCAFDQPLHIAVFDYIAARYGKPANCSAPVGGKSQPRSSPRT